MMFSSGRHQSIRRSSQWGIVRGGFESPSNPTNPILIESRGHLGSVANPAAMLATWLRWIDQPEASSEDAQPWTGAQRDHARKVLTRLASFQKES